MLERSIVQICVKTQVYRRTDGILSLRRDAFVSVKQEPEINREAQSPYSQNRNLRSLDRRGCQTEAQIQEIESENIYCHMCEEVHINNSWCQFPGWEG